MEWLVFVSWRSRPRLGARPDRSGATPSTARCSSSVNLVCVAVLYLMLRAEFLALAQVIVYAGAIMVLFVFAIMVLIPGKEETGPDPLARAAPAGPAGRRPSPRDRR